MKTYYAKKGRWKARSAAHLVSMMHHDSFSPEIDDITWMRKTAARVEMFLGAKIRYTKAHEFVADLIACNLLFEGYDENGNAPK